MVKSKVIKCSKHYTAEEMEQVLLSHTWTAGIPVKATSFTVPVFNFPTISATSPMYLRIMPYGKVPTDKWQISTVEGGTSESTGKAIGRNALLGALGPIGQIFSMFDPDNKRIKAQWEATVTEFESLNL